MCEYCDGYVSAGKTDYRLIDQQSIPVLDFVEIEVDIYIGSTKEKKPVIKVVNSTWANNAGPYSETIKSIPITYCPFCGQDLESYRREVSADV